MAELNQQQFGISPHEHLGLLKHAYSDYEGPHSKPDWWDDAEDGDHQPSGGVRERGKAYGHEDFQVLRVEQLPKPDPEGSTHEVEIERGQRHRTIYGWNRDTDEKRLWAD